MVPSGGKIRTSMTQWLWGKGSSVTWRSFIATISGGNPSSQASSSLVSSCRQCPFNLVDCVRERGDARRITITEEKLTPPTIRHDISAMGIVPPVPTMVNQAYRYGSQALLAVICGVFILLGPSISSSYSSGLHTLAPLGRPSLRLCRRHS